MTFSYSGDPSQSDIDAIRFLIQDTVSSDAFLTDEEIQYLYDTWYPVYKSNIMVAAVAAETVAAKFAREVSISADGVSVGANELQNKFAQLALNLREQFSRYDVGAGPELTGVLWSDYPDPSIKPSLFQIGMHDNISAGNQSVDSPSPLSIPEIDGGY